MTDQTTDQTTETCYVCISGEMTWGRGPSPADAKTAAGVGHRTTKYIVYRIDGDSRPSIDDMCRVCATNGAKWSIVASKGMRIPPEEMSGTFGFIID